MSLENIGAPQEIRRQLDQLSNSLCEIEGSNMIGVYLHGSLAMGCFQYQRSDLDLLVLTEQPPTPTRQRDWASQILAASNAPAPIEISILHRSQYTPWRHPAPFSFHFSEEWRARIGQALQDSSWQSWNWDEMRDPDLAAHFTVARRRGIRLAGTPIEKAIPPIPWADYLNSILADLTWACERADENPVYLVLNACRIWAAVDAQVVLSKAEGARWAQPQLPPGLAAIVATAVAIYTGQVLKGPAEQLTGSEALRVAQWVGERL